MICPNIHIKEVKDSFNEMVEALGGRPLTDEEFKSSELRNQRTGLDYSAMNAAYRSYHRNNGNMLDKAPNGKDSVLFNSLLNYFGNRADAIKAKSNVYTDLFFNWFGDWTTSRDSMTSELVFDELEKYANDGDGIHAKLIRFFLDNFKNEIKHYTPRLGSGMFDPIDGTIHFPKHEWGKEDGEFEYHENRKIALHELIHSITSTLLIGYYVYKDPSYEKEIRHLGYIGDIPKLSKEQIKAFDELVKIKKKVSDYFDKHPEDINNTDNPYGSNIYYRTFEQDINGFELDEFISEAFSNPTLLQVMAKIPSSKESKKTIFDKFIELLAKIFNIKGSILEDFVSAAHDALSPVYKNSHSNSVSKAVDENGEPLVVWHGSRVSNNIEVFHDRPTYFADRYTAFSYTPFEAENESEYMYPVYLNIKSPQNVDGNGSYFSNINGKTTDEIVKESSDNNDGVIISNIKDYSDFTPGNPDLSKDLLDEAPLHTDYVTKQLNQIKHVKNLGNWSPQDNNIYHESFDLINTSMFTKDPFLKLAYEARMKDNKHMSIEEAFDYISTTEIGKSVVLLLNYVAKSKGKSLIPKNLTIRVVSGIAMPYTAGPKLQGHRASYDADTNTIYIDSDAYYENSSAANVLLHEIMHAITLGLLENDSEARAKLENVLDVYRKAYPNQYFSADPHSLAEFVADIWTNPLTIKRLKEIPYKTESLFDRIINILKQLFKTFFKEDTLFAEASKILVELLESTPADRKGTAGIYFATNPTTAQIQKEYDDISNKIRSLFSELYKRFDKMPNKSNTRRKTLTEIFKTIQRLKQELADKAIEIALETAAEQLGVINQQTGAPQSSDNLYAWFVNQEAKDKPYENVTPQLIQDIYKHLIGFYREVLATIPDGASMMLNPTTRLNRLDVLSQLDIIENMWKHAVEMIGEREIDNMIDNFTGLTIPQEQKENMKVVYRDWLHKNWFYGDIVGFTSLFTSYGQSPNPIVKITFHLTQYAEQKTQEELIAKAVPILEKFQSVNTTASWVKPGWQKIFQEVNKDGIPTGKWVRDINYGQYEQDLNEFVQELNDDFDARYGHHYIYDELGMPKNSVTGEYAEDEEWVGGIMPHYVEYLLDLYAWKTQHATLRYTLQYYLERLSRPYDEVSYPQGHGLSLKTLQRYENVQNIINYYLGLCTGEDGIPHPERPKDKGGLTDYERIELDKAKQELKDISSPFEADGTPKVDEEYQMAMEILTWLKYVSNILKGFDYDYAAFNKALNEATALSQLLNDPSILANFYKYNSDILIDPDFLESIFGVSENISSANIIIKQIHLKCLENLTKIKDNLYTRDIEPFRNNVLFWMNYRQLVQDVMDNKQYDRIVDPIEDLEDVADYYEVPYVDSNGNMYDIFGAVATNTTPRTQIMTWLGYIVNYYKDIAVLNNGIIPGVDDQYGNPIIFQGSDMEIANQVKATLFQYEATWWDKNGKMHTKMRPLPMFTVLLPKDDKYIVHVPTGRFAKPKQSILTNPLFDEKSGIAEQPLRAIYDNTKAYNKVMKNKLTRELYEYCIQCMQEMQKVMGFNNKTFNYKLPMLNADTSALLSRADIKSILKSSTEIQNDDTDMRNVDAGIKTADGRVAFDIPLRLLLDLKDMRNLSSDVVQSVILYIQMAYNYRNKKAISDTILTIHDNLTENVRNRTATDYDRFSDNPTNMDQAIDDENSLKQYEAMMDSTLYGMDTGKSSKAHKEPTKGEIFARKAGNSIVRFEAVATLGLNLLSIFAGGYDSISKMLRESILNRYMSIVDLTKSIIYVLLHLPKVVANIGNPLANCKIVALMLLNKLSKDYGKVVDNLNHNRVIKTLNNLLMGGYSMFDYFSNMILLRAHYRNVRFYDGDVIPKGFYTAYEMRQAFKAAGKSWKEGSLAHTLCKTSLWSVYEFDEHKAVVKDDYISEAEKAKADAGGVGLKWSDFVTDRVKTDIMTKSLQRSALYNGMAPDNDRARYLKTIWGKAIFAMRNWYQMVLQRALIGTDDTSVRKVADTNKESIRFGKTFFKPGKKVESRTEEQSYNRMGWNFETGAPQEEIVKSMFRGVIKMLRMAKAAISFKFGDFKNIKLSNVEKYGIRGFITLLLYLELLFYSFIPIMNMAQQVPMPTNKKDAELSISNMLRDAKNLFVLWWANAHIRAYESNKAEVNPLEPKAFIKTSSALMGALDHQTALLDMAEEGAGMSTHTLDEVISTGSKYKYYTRGERYVYQSVGPLNNMVTSLTIPGVKYNTQWYMNMYGDAYRQKGYDFRIGSGSKLNSNRPKVKRPEIKRPKIKRPKIKRPRR